MKERVWLSFILELSLAALCLFFGFDEGRLNAFIVYALIIACLIAARLLIALLKAPVWLSWVCALGCAAAIFLFGQDVCIALVGILAFNVISEGYDKRLALVVALVLAVALAIAFAQVPASLVGFAVGLVLAFFGNLLLQRLSQAQRELVAKDERIASLETQLENQRETISAIEQQGRQAERNRLTARIHDKVGHGMTGSVLLLEAAKLQIEKNPEAALVSIDRAAENLRESVDEIRRELREERAISEQASLVMIAQTLDEFSESHEGIRTELITEGAMLDSVPQAVWFCIHESLLETLTNMLKHSNGDKFSVFISLQKRLLYVEFSDNGTGSQADEEVKVIQGIGLAGIEERVLLNGGKVFFFLKPQGFSTRMTFALRGHQ